MAKLKMVAGKTYVCPALFGVERVIQRGEVVEVPDDKAAVLLDDSYTDALNNTHHYFDVVEGATAEGGEAPAPKAKRTRTAA